MARLDTVSASRSAFSALVMALTNDMAFLISQSSSKGQADTFALSDHGIAELL